jgi:uncharacterized protein YbjT (DUF2867 family)
MSGLPTIAVTGATGFVGRHLVRELLGRGHSVRALVRCEDRAGEVLPSDSGLSLVVGDAFDQRVLDSLCQSADALVNSIGILRESSGGQTFKRIHIVATRRLAEAAQRARCGRVVQISALGVTDNPQTEYQRTKLEAERIVRASGLDWTIIRPGLIHGRDGEFMQMAKGWATGRIAPFLFMPYFARVTRRFPRPEFESARIQPVFVEDVARAVGECLEREASIGEVYSMAGGETLTWPELLEFVRDRVQLARPGIRALPIPAEIAARKAQAAGMLGLGALLPFDYGMAKMGASDSVAPSLKLREHLGFDPAGFRETAAGYVAAL